MDEQLQEERVFHHAQRVAPVRARPASYRHHTHWTQEQNNDEYPPS